MKRNLNLSVYNLLGYLLLGIAAYAFVNANNTDLQATAPVTEDKQAQFNLDAIVKQINNFDQKIYHKDPWHVQVFESEKVQELADLKRKELEASINLEKAIASLDEAKLNYQKQQYEHSLKVSDYQTLMQRQQNQIDSLQSQLDTVDEELDKLTSYAVPLLAPLGALGLVVNVLVLWNTNYMNAAVKQLQDQGVEVKSEDLVLVNH